MRLANLKMGATAENVLELRDILNQAVLVWWYERRRLLGARRSTSHISLFPLSDVRCVKCESISVVESD